MGDATGDASAKTSERNLYEVIRDQLIDDIESGRAYPAGALLPSVREITVKWTVSTTTARKVQEELAAAGYARSEGTRGYVSLGPRPQEAPDRDPTPSDATPPEVPTVRAKPGRVAVRTPQVVKAGESLESQTQTVDVRVGVPPAEVTLALRLEDPSTPVVIRRRLAVDAHGVPVQLRTSYVLRRIAEGTRLAQKEPIELPWLDAIAQLTDVQVRLTESHAAARHPTDSEAAALALTPTASVLVRVDITHDEHHEPIDYTATVWPGEQTRLMIESAGADPDC